MLVLKPIFPCFRKLVVCIPLIVTNQLLKYMLLHGMKAILSKLFDAIHCFYRLPTFFGLYFALCLISVVRFLKYVKLLWILGITSDCWYYLLHMPQSCGRNHMTPLIKRRWYYFTIQLWLVGMQIWLCKRFAKSWRAENL